MDAGKSVNRLKGEFVIEAQRLDANRYVVALKFVLPDGGAVRYEQEATAPDIALRAMPLRPFETFLDTTTRHSQAFRQFAMRVFAGIPDPEDATPAVTAPSPDGATPPPVPPDVTGVASSGSGKFRTDKQRSAAERMRAKWAAKRAAKESANAESNPA
jgi:hypothetical protein